MCVCVYVCVCVCPRTKIFMYMFYCVYDVILVKWAKVLTWQTHMQGPKSMCNAYSALVVNFVQFEISVSSRLLCALAIA